MTHRGILTRWAKATFTAYLALFIVSPAFAQGEDGTRAERNLQIIAETLPGIYDNANQAYFDKRLNEPEDQRHVRFNAKLSRIEAPALGQYVFLSHLKDSNDTIIPLLFSLETDSITDVVRMKVFEPGNTTQDNYNYQNARYLNGCDILWREEAGQFRAIAEQSRCTASTSTPSAMLLSEDALWMTFHGDKRSYFTLERTRNFSCYIDVPGVGGGRDIPYKRYQITDIHDKGGKAWVKLDDGSEVSIMLQNIRWPMNNLKNIFTRHSFVIYIGQKQSAEDEEKEITYAWTVPKAQRIGVNLKWMLVNCFMLNNEEVTPFFKEEPIL